MSMEEHYQKLINMYYGARTNEYYRPELAIRKGAATLKIPVREDFFHAGGAVHGSVYFKAADDAAWFAANSLIKGVFVLTASFHLHLLRPITRGVIRAEGRVVQYSPTLIAAESILYNDKNKEVGRGSGTFARSKQALTPDIGYK